MQQYFVTGTDTGVGKTTVSCYLLKAMAQEGHSTLALKPVATGGGENPQGSPARRCFEASTAFNATPRLH